MKILMLTDTHFLFKRIDRIRELQLLQLDYVARYIEDNKIDYIFMLGDFMDEAVKNNINEVKEQFMFLKKLYEMRNLVKKLVIITGNHDHYSLENHSLLFFKIIQDEKIIFADKLETIKLEDDLTILPLGFNIAMEVAAEVKSFANKSLSREEMYNEVTNIIDERINKINNKENIIFLGHLGTIEVLPMALGNEPVLKIDTLKKFKKSFLGHIHEIKTDENVHFIGSFGRTAINENKGHFTVYDTKTDKIEYIDNKPEIEFLRIKLNNKADLDKYSEKDLSCSIVYLEESFDVMNFKDEIHKTLNNSGAIEIIYVKDKKDKKELNLDYKIEGVEGIGHDFINSAFEKLALQHANKAYPNKSDFVFEKTKMIFEKALKDVTGE